MEPNSPSELVIMFEREFAHLYSNPHGFTIRACHMGGSVWDMGLFMATMCIG
jgi:hypothetical protein